MTSVVIRRSAAADAGELFTLQRAAFVDEAFIYETPEVPPLAEDFAAFVTRLGSSTSWCAVEGSRIVGAVSLRSYRSGGPDVERLMVAPDRRGHGIARLLLNAAEAHSSQHGVSCLQLIVGDLATGNRRIYEHLGWVYTSSFDLDGYPGVRLWTMAKKI